MTGKHARSPALWLETNEPVIVSHATSCGALRMGAHLYGVCARTTPAAMVTGSGAHGRCHTTA